MRDKSDSSPRLASQTLFRGLDVIDAVAAGCLTAKDIASHIELPFSTAHRLASALVQARYLTFEPRHGYKLGTRLMELGFVAYQSSNITRSARAEMEKLAAQTKDTVHLAQLDGDEVFYLDKIDGQRPINVNSRIGGRKPISSTGVGKALILNESEETWKARYAYDAAQGALNVKPDIWLNAMRTYAAGEYTLDLEENAANVCCVSAPIRGADYQIVAAISVSAPTDYTNETELRARIPLVQEAARTISRNIGGKIR